MKVRPQIELQCYYATLAALRTPPPTTAAAATVPRPRAIFSRDRFPSGPVLFYLLRLALVVLINVEASRASPNSRMLSTRQPAPSSVYHRLPVATSSAIRRRHPAMLNLYSCTNSINTPNTNRLACFSTPQFSYKRTSKRNN